MKDKQLVYWDENEKKLIGSVSNKIKKYFNLNLIEKINDDNFIIKPIPNYNITTHKIVNGECDCQGFHKYGNCSHLKAVAIYKELNGEGLKKWL